MAEKSHTGQGGKSFQDRELAAKVRTLALNQLLEVLNGNRFEEDKEFHKAVLLKLAGTVLPRLNEHTGADGQDLVLMISGETAERYGRTGTTPNSKTSSTG